MLAKLGPPLCWSTRMFLQYVGPLSFLRTLYQFFIASRRTTRTYRSSVRYTLFSLWLNLESFFFCMSFADRYLYGRFYRTQRPSHWPNFPAKRRKELFNRIMRQNAKTAEDGQRWLVGWFGNCKYEDLRVENLREFLAWAWFDQKDCTNLNEAELSEVESTLSNIQKLTGVMRSGRNNDIITQRQSIDPWYNRTTAHPLLFYAGVSLVEHVASPIVMRNMLGFERRVECNVGYWYFSGEGEPILFFHGIGVGLAPYYQVMRTLMSTGRPLYVAEIPEATLSMSTSVPFYHATPISAREILQTWDQILPPDAYKFSVVGHSYGTVLAAWFLEHRRDRVLNCCMCDPVSIMLHHADVCDRFLYGGMSSRARVRGRSQKDLLMQWIVREEPGIVLTLMRNFWWYKNTAWLEDLSPAKSGVLLGLADEYAAVAKIVAGIEEYNTDVAQVEEEKIWLKTYRGIPHGLFLVHRRMQQDMLEVLQRR